jgi:hypothetical protein
MRGELDLHYSEMPDRKSLQNKKQNEREAGKYY